MSTSIVDDKNRFDHYIKTGSGTLYRLGEKKELLPAALAACRSVELPRCDALVFGAGAVDGTLAWCAHARADLTACEAVRTPRVGGV